MCGILAVLKPMTTASLLPLARRGPDSSNSFQNADIYLGHTRLALVNPDAQDQPIYYADWVGIMNGEIYNSPYPKPNETDCHHLITTIAQHGPHVLSLMDGVFSFVMFQKSTKRIIMGRDAIGVTPMYYSDQVISSLLTCITTGEAKCVPPGSYADFILGSEVIWHKWTPSYAFTSPSDECLYLTLRAAVSKRLMGTVPWGILLSGGLDSSIVASIAVDIAAELRPDYPVCHSFCIGLSNSPDVVQAKRLAVDLGTVHHSIEYTVEEGLACLAQVVRAVETYDVTTIRASTPMWLLGKAIKKRGIKMVLSGEGADELFAGYLYNRYCPNEEEMEAECKRKMDQLYAYDCLRANKSMGDWGIETRVPFLDNTVVDYAMNGLSPGSKLSGTHPDGPKAEKWFLRRAFEGKLPDYILKRTKAQFSDAVGSEWIDALQGYASKRVSDEMLTGAVERWPYQTPETKEAYLYREFFSEIFDQVTSAEATVIYQPSIACSTGEAAQWHTSFQNCLDPSGDAIHRAFGEA